MGSLGYCIGAFGREGGPMGSLGYARILSSSSSTPCNRSALAASAASLRLSASAANTHCTFFSKTAFTASAMFLAACSSKLTFESSSDAGRDRPSDASIITSLSLQVRGSTMVVMRVPCLSELLSLPVASSEPLF